MAKNKKGFELAEIITDKCIGCQVCTGVCPVGAIEMAEGTARIDPEICIGCGKCVDVCPVDSIKFEGKRRKGAGPKKAQAGRPRLRRGRHLRRDSGRPGRDRIMGACGQGQGARGKARHDRDRLRPGQRGGGRGKAGHSLRLRRRARYRRPDACRLPVPPLRQGAKRPLRCGQARDTADRRDPGRPRLVRRRGHHPGDRADGGLHRPGHRRGKAHPADDAAYLRRQHHGDYILRAAQAADEHRQAQGLRPAERRPGKKREHPSSPVRSPPGDLPSVVEFIKDAGRTAGSILPGSPPL